MNYDHYKKDFELESKLKEASQKKTKIIILFVVLTLCLLLSAVVFGALNIGHIAFYVLYLWLGVLLFIIIYLPPWSTPKCSCCGKRLKKVYKDIAGGNEQLFYVCEDCKLIADSSIVRGD